MGAPVGRPPKYKTPEEMQVDINAFFDACKETEQPPTISGLAYALGMTRHGLMKYEVKPEFVTTVKRAKQQVEMYLESILLTRPAVTGVIFNLKNNFGWKDTVDNKVSGDADNPVAHTFRWEND